MAVAWADQVQPYDEIGEHLRAAQQVAPLTDSAFGDHITLYNGATSFEATDISIPGNNALPVQLGRSYSIQAKPWNDGFLGGFGEWNLDVPYIDAVVTTDNGWTLKGGTPYSRCSDTTDLLNTIVSQTAPAPAQINLIYDGTKLHVPGAGDQELLVNTQSKSPAHASAATYKWVTLDNWKISCLASTANGYAGEGFVALSPSGVSYTFNWAVVNPVSAINVGKFDPRTTGTYVDRSRVFLLATQVKDRFGNTVSYNYTGSELTSITSSDGRSISLSWNADGTIHSATSEPGTTSAQTWTYNYGADVNGYTTLTSVVLPDNSAWTYTNVSGSLTTQRNTECGPFCPGDGIDPPLIHCQSTYGFTPYAKLGTFTYSVTAPSGATATYNFEFDRHYRYGVPMSCNDGNVNHAYPDDLAYYDGFSILSKQITGPGIPVDAHGKPPTWTYDTGGVYADDSGQAPGYFDAGEPYDSQTQVYIPGGGSCSNAAGSGYNVTVTGPTSITQYDFGGDFGCDEGRLYGSRVKDLSGNVLKTTTSNYIPDTAVSSEPFPTIAGSTQLGNDAHPSGNRIRPVISTQVTQDSATFSDAVNNSCAAGYCFDAFARATSETESGSSSKTVATLYYDDLAHWVLGQVGSVAVNGTAGACAAGDTTLASCTTYDPTTALPLNSYAFGKLVSAKGWNADGTLHTITDGNTHTTTLSSWKRGLPQGVTYADQTGESAEVNDAGWITSVTDENGYTTGYGYDPMGRLSEIDYPSGDDVAWNKTVVSFAPVGTSEYGIPAGHWKQTIQTGNGKTVTMFDALWRPLLTETLDTTNVSGTLSQTLQRYDVGGRVVFKSYPLNNSGVNYSTYNTGIHTSYDALGRVTEVDQDSELGTIGSTTHYLAGFQTQVTNPRGYATTTSYQTFGAPDTSRPVSIASPEGVTTTITRDVYGKPLGITRKGTYAGATVSVTRSFVYDANQQLCKRIDPETGATVMAYDGAGNLQWTAAGLDLPGTTTCDTSTAYGSGRRVDRGYDQRNRIKSMTYPDGYSNTSYDYYLDGALEDERVDNAGQPVTTKYSYDRRRLLTGETLTLPGTAPFSIGYGHDANGHLSSTTYPDGRVVGYLPNALGQASQVGSYATGVSYYPNGGIHQFTYGNGIVHTMTQDTRELPDRSTDSYAGTAVLDNGYDYDANANVAAITDYLPGNVGNRTMTYDGLDRLTQAVSPMFGGDNTAAYSYDPVDNLRSARVGNVSNFNYWYDPSNKLTNLVDPNSGATITGFSYDLQGNLANKNGQLYQFDESNRLRSVDGVESYLYDAAGHRVQKTQVGSGSTIDADYSKDGVLMSRTDPVTTTASDYIYLGGSLVAEITNNNSQVTGTIDEVLTSGTDASVNGWACSTGMNQSINVELYVGGPAGGGGVHIGAYPANQASEPAVASACQASGSNYRYSIALSSATRDAYAGQPIYIYGDSPVGNNNNQLSNSGTYAVPANPYPPVAPASITVPASSITGSVTVSWAASLNTTSYVLQQSADGGGTWTQIYTGTAIQQLVSGLGNGTYQYRVEACNVTGCSAFTTSGTLTVALPPPTPASISVPASSSTGSVAVSWAAAPTTTSYVLQQSLNGGAWTQVYNGTGTSLALSLGNGSYKYRAEACNASGCSAFVTSGTLTVAIIPATPASITAPSSVNAASFAVSWSASANTSSYVLQQSASGGAWTQIYSGSAASFTVTVSLTGSYQYRVEACGAGGCSAYRTSGAVAVTVPPASAPVLYGSGSSTTGTFTLTWTAITNATRYQLNQKLNSGAWTTVYNSSGRSWSSSGLANGTYTYEVYACNTAACSAASNLATVTVSPIPATPASISAPAQVDLGISFTVSWSAVTGATSYTLQRTNTDTGRVATPYTGSATSTSDQPPVSGFYQYSVKACNSAGCSGWRTGNTTDVEPSGGPNIVSPASGSSL